MSNGLIKRTFYTNNAGAFCTVEFRHEITGVTYFRGLSPEANLTLASQRFDVGSCLGQPDGHYEFWDPNLFASKLTADVTAFQFANYTVLPTTEKPYEFTPGLRHSDHDVAWPPLGVHLVAVGVGAL